jgi:hypothetical protein
MRAVASTALAVFALAAPSVALAGVAVGASCTPAHEESYESHGLVCVEVGGRHRLAQIVIAPARPDQPRQGTVVKPLHPK